MTTFTKAQAEAMMAATKATGTVEEYLTSLGLTLATDAPVVKATRAVRPKGKTAVVIVYAASTGHALVTTNSGFAGRTDEWIIADWKQTAQSSRKSDDRFIGLTSAVDVAVYQSELLDSITAQDKLNVEIASANHIAKYINSGYEFISKIKRTTQMMIEPLLTSGEVAEPEAIASHYNAVIGATGLLNNPYVYNTKTGNFNKARKAAKK